jgi:hypothetical protein
MKRLIFLLCFCLPLFTTAQLGFIRWDGASVVDSMGKQLNLPWVGGLNSAQFSEIDLNQDGIKDLFIFDRQGGSKLTFLNNGTPDTVDYVYAPQYEQYFPDNINFILLKDYNCDEKEDLFMQYPAGMSVYKNVGDTVPQFELVTPLLHTMGFSWVNLYISQIDIPALTDIDDDGDMDIVVFGIGGSTAEFNENMSMDSLGNCDSLWFVTTDYCWGKFEEHFATNNVTLGITCKGGGGSSSGSSVHSGSAIACFDLDGDNDKEAILGDFSFSNLVTLTNGGDTSFANMIAQDTTYPFYDKPVDLDIFPAPYHLDVDNDGLKDLVVCPNTYLNAENAQSVWFYKNVGRVDSPFFSFQTETFLQGDMIDVGTAANPVFFDYNDDGKMDLAIGNEGYYAGVGMKTGKLAMYENVGSTTSPSFRLITRDFANLSAFGLTGLYPAFADLDGDNDQDMLLGDEDGMIHLFENTAGAGNPAAFTLQTPNYDSIDVGQFAAPQLVDVDRDNVKDLLIGERNGNINYYRNTGTNAAPIFTFVTDTFGGIDVREPGYVTGYSTPMLSEMDSSGAYYMVVGSQSGRTFLYGNIDGNVGGSFSLLDTAIMQLDLGARTAAAAADLDGDLIREVVIGNERGGVTLLTQTENDTTTPPNLIGHSKVTFDVTIFPVPAKDKVGVIVRGTAPNAVASLYDLTGRLIQTKRMNRQGATSFDLSALPNSMYLVKVKASNGEVYRKLIKH